MTEGAYGLVTLHLLQKDEVFGFHFNLIVSNGGELETYHLNKTCTPALPWVQKEVTCEVNYMEVIMRLPVGNTYSGLSCTMLFSPQVLVMREVTCPSKMWREDWNAFRLVYDPLTALLKVLHCFK